MKKILMFCLLAALGMAAVAQTSNDNGRRTVIVGEVSGSESALMKYYLMEGLASTKRLNLFDSRLYNRMPQAMRDKVKADAVFTAVLDSLTTRKETLNDGKSMWKSYCYVTLNVRDPKTNKVLTTQKLKGYGSDLSDREETRRAAMMTVSNDLNAFVDSYYVIHGRIITVDELKNNKAQLVTIDLGSSSSIYSNMQFVVLNANGDKVGDLQVKKIVGSDRTYCTVTRGGEAIKTAVENNEPLTVRSKPLDVINDLITIEKKVSAIVNEPKPDCNRLHTVLYLGAVGDNEAESYIDNMVVKELYETKRLRALTLDQYNKLDAATLASLDIEGVVMAVAGTPKVNEDRQERYTSYSIRVNWMFMITDAVTGEVLCAESEIASGLSTESRAKAFEKAFRSMSQFNYSIDCAYPIYTSIVTVDEVNKKKAKIVSIGVGTNSALYKGMLLSVYTKNVDGIWNEIGEVKVKELLNDQASTCSVSKGAEAILNAVEEGIETRVVTKPKSFLGGLLKL